MAAFTAVLLIGFELVLTHWSYLYVPWFFPFVAMALVAPLAGGPPADPEPTEPIQSEPIQSDPIQPDPTQPEDDAGPAPAFA
jgi:hypothetical protein